VWRVVADCRLANQYSEDPKIEGGKMLGEVRRVHPPQGIKGPISAMGHIIPAEGIDVEITKDLLKLHSAGMIRIAEKAVVAPPGSEPIAEVPEEYVPSPVIVEDEKAPQSSHSEGLPTTLFVTMSEGELREYIKAKTGKSPHGRCRKEALIKMAEEASEASRLSMNTTDANPPEKCNPDRGDQLALFGPPPLFDGEDTKSYDELLTGISNAVKPADILEDVWVRDVVDLTFEVFRLRRLKVNLIMANEYKGLSETLTPLVGRSQAETLGEGWAARKSDVVEEVNKTLASAGLSIDSILAQTLSLKLDDVERIEHMTAIAEARRNAALREIDRHRETLGHKLRRAMQQLEDGQLRVIESRSIDGTNAE
jgi:hypothetical protein